jgi:CRP/FNR family cyclic AMP-dependent transcriptional regulator
MMTVSALLTEQPFFAGMRPIHLERLSFYARRGVFRPGARVFNEGGHADRFWVIREGRVELDTHVPGRPDTVVEALGPGSVLGWSWLFAPYTWHFGAVATEPTLTIDLDAAGVRRLCEHDPEIGYELTTRFMAVVVERLQATRTRLLDLYGGND